MDSIITRLHAGFLNLEFEEQDDQRENGGLLFFIVSGKITKVMDLTKAHAYICNRFE